MPLSQLCWLSVMERSVLCPLSSVRLCCHSISSLRRTCCHPGGRARMWRSRSFLRGYYLGAVAPRFLAAFHRLCVVAKRALVDSGLLAWTYHCLWLGDWSLGLASSFVLLPSAAFPWDVMVEGLCMSPQFEMLSVLFPGNIGFHFFRISRSFVGYV